MILDAAEAVPVRVEVSGQPWTSLPLVDAGVPLIDVVSLRNVSSRRFPGGELAVEWHGEESPPGVAVPIPPIEVGEEVTVGPIAVPAPRDWLARLAKRTGPEGAAWTLRGADEEVASGEHPFWAHPPDDWPGLQGPPQLLASLVVRDHPVVKEIARRVGTEKDVDALEALWTLVRGLDLALDRPADGLESGARLRLPDRMLRDGRANALELALLYAAAAERLGFAPILAWFADHVLVGLWASEGRFPEGIVASRSRLAHGEGARLFDGAMLARGAGRRDLASAAQSARAVIEGHAELRFVVDVEVLRGERWPPLAVPFVALDADADLVGLTGQVLASAARVGGEDPPGDPSPEPAVVPRFRVWKERLLDLSLRNRLLAFRPAARTTVPLEIPSLPAFADRLAVGGAWIELVSGDASDGRVRVPLADDERMARALALDRTARAAFDEGGANTAFAALGFLRWAEAPGAPVERLAPLVLVPIELELQRSARKVRIRRLAEDALVNVTLIEKLRRDFDLDLSDAQELESDEHPIDVARFIEGVRRAVSAVSGWEVEETGALAHLTFAKFLLWRDLEDNAERLLESPVVAHLARGGTTDFPNPAPATAPATVDDASEPGALPLVLDADGTQVAAIHSALSGRSFVLQGPPGTGKSQTIVNLVAAGIAAGKRVLVVAEKVAALDVVHRRLREVGLGEWVLELHSHKANKREVVEELASVLRREATGPAPAWDARIAEVAAVRNELNAYVRALHAPRAAGATFYEASARLLPVRTQPRIALGLRDPGGLTEQDWERFADRAERFAALAVDVEPVGAHPFAGTRPDEWSEALEQGLEARIAKASELLSVVEQTAAELGAALEIEVPPYLAPILDLAQLANALGDSPVPPLALQPGSGYLDAARLFSANLKRWENRSRGVAQRWHPGIYRADGLERLVRRFAVWSKRPAWLAWLFLRAPRNALRTYARKGLPDNATIATDLEGALDVEQNREPLILEKKRLQEGSGGIWTGEGADELVKLAERAQDALDQVRTAREAGHAIPDRVLAVLDPATPQDRRRQMNKRGNEATRAVERFRTAWKAVIDQLRPASVPAEPELDEYRDRLARWSDARPRFREWALYNKACAELEAASLGAVVDLHQADPGRGVHAPEVPSLVARSVLHEWVAAIRDEDDALRTFSGAERHRAVARFRKLDQQLVALAARQVTSLLEQRVPRVGADAPDTSEPGILLREAGKKARHKPIRRLMEEIPTLVGRLKPCLLMSPLSVAQYLPANGRRFDLVIFDEASQIGTHDAIGALARGDQVIVVGDSRQLPPTTFFQRAQADEPDENDFEEVQSILEEAVAARLPEQRLGWHYRSRHQDLIRFSNEHYYDGSLAVFPAARSRSDELGIRWHYVPQAAYDKARTRTNPVEAKHVTDYLVRELLRTVPGERTFGIVTFSLAQQGLIADLLDEARRARPEIEGHFTGLLEPVFVKNLESVQGDERDEILFSIGYGPDEDGQVWMNFGPLNREGGERRLNVAVTRARRQLRVFSSLRHDQIDLARTRARGARHLREFLRYAAEVGVPGERPVPVLDYPTAFEQEVGAALQARGWDIATRVGSGPYRVDVAVLHPERAGEYILAVELDGAAYASAATARDRDRLRQTVLEGLGWRLHRIWSSDWWFDRSKELRRLEQALDDALVGDSSTEEETEPISVVLEQDDDDDDDGPTVLRASSDVEAYVEAEPTAVTDQGSLLHDADLVEELSRVIEHVIVLEAPIHLTELTRRVGAAFGVTKITARAQKRVLTVARRLDPPAVLRGEFIWPANLDPDAYDRVRGPTPQGQPGRAIEHIPPEEIAHAIHRILAENLSMSTADLVRETGRMFGIQRVGRKVSDGIGAGLQILVDRGQAEVLGERVVART